MAQTPAGSIRATTEVGDHCKYMTRAAAETSRYLTNTLGCTAAVVRLSAFLDEIDLVAHRQFTDTSSIQCEHSIGQSRR